MNPTIIEYKSDDDKLKTYKYGLVIQGPVRPSVDCLMKMIKYYFLNSTEDTLIVLSTYEESLSDIKNMISEHFSTNKKWLERFAAVFLQEPSKVDPKYKYFWETNRTNQNLQRITSYYGLFYAATRGVRFGMKTRTDQLIGMPNACEYVKNIWDKYPTINFSGEKKPNGRIVILSTGTMCVHHSGVFAPYHLRDQWYFGDIEDLLDFFDINSPKWNWGRTMYNDTAPESNITRCWMDDMNIPQNISVSELILRFFITLDTSTLEVFFLKFRGFFNEFLETPFGSPQRQMLFKWIESEIFVERERRYSVVEKDVIDGIEKALKTKQPDKYDISPKV